MFTFIITIVMVIYRHTLGKDFDDQNAFIVIWFYFEVALKACEIFWYTIHALQTMIPKDSPLIWIARAVGGGGSKEVEDSEQNFKERLKSVEESEEPLKKIVTNYSIQDEAIKEDPSIRGSQILYQGEKLKDTELEAFEAKISDKNHVHFHENFVSLAVLCYLKDNVKE